MRIQPAAAGILLISLVVGCNQPLSPVGPTSFSSAGPSISPAGVDGTATQIGGNATAGLSAMRELPFKGRLEGLVTASTPIEPPFLSVSIEATGNATHLGRFTLDIPHVVNTVTRIGTGTFEFRAANGDMLTAEFVTEATLIAPGVLSTVDTATITGGTGRFATATGSFTGSRVFVLATGAITGSFEGTISTADDSTP